MPARLGNKMWPTWFKGYTIPTIFIYDSYVIWLNETRTLVLKPSNVGMVEIGTLRCPVGDTGSLFLSMMFSTPCTTFWQNIATHDLQWAMDAEGVLIDGPLEYNHCRILTAAKVDHFPLLCITSSSAQLSMPIYYIDIKNAWTIHWCK